MKRIKDQKIKKKGIIKNQNIKWFQRKKHTWSLIQGYHIQSSRSPPPFPGANATLNPAISSKEKKKVNQELI